MSVCMSMCVPVLMLMLRLKTVPCITISRADCTCFSIACDRPQMSVCTSTRNIHVCLHVNVCACILYRNPSEVFSVCVCVCFQCVYNVCIFLSVSPLLSLCPCSCLTDPHQAKVGNKDDTRRKEEEEKVQLDS